MNELNRKVVTVVGSGESGESAIHLGLRHGARIRCSSLTALKPSLKSFLKSHDIPYEEGEHSAHFLDPSDLVVVSPGVRPESFPVTYCLKKKIPVVSEVEFASRWVKGPWVAITGTNGKTTTTTLLADILKKKSACDACGNIGNAFSRSLMDQEPRIPRVVEVSSFQLKFIDRFKPNVAVILNLSPNHLDWHPNLKDYYASKLRIARNLTSKDTLILNADDKLLVRYTRLMKARKVYFSKDSLKEGVTSDGKAVYSVHRGKKRKIADLARCRLKGDHHLENIMAAVQASLTMGISSKKIQQTLDEAKPLKHRLESLGQTQGIQFVNDSKSTTVKSTLAAIRRYDKDIVLIVGGKSKQKAYRNILSEMKRRVSYLVLYGEARNFLKSEFKDFSPKLSVSTFEDAVHRAFRKARSGQTLLLSPMCSSFDQFASYEERGEAFRDIFKELKEKS